MCKFDYVVFSGLRVDLRVTQKRMKTKNDGLQSLHVQSAKHAT